MAKGSARTDELTHEFVVPFDYSAEALWEVISDTQRLNALSGNPKYEVFEVPHDDDLGVDIMGQVRVAGITLQWQELTPNWIEPHWFFQARRFKGGPFAQLGARMEIVPYEGKLACRGQLTVKARFRLSRFVALQIAKKTERTFRAMVEEASTRLRTQTPVAVVPRHTINPTSRERAYALAEAIEATPHGHSLAKRLATHLLEAPELDLWSLRPLALAAAWNAEPRHVVELFLQAVKVGLLESRWDLLCPRCRLSKDDAVRMDELPEGVHCPSCNIDYKLDFARNVELAFSPGPAIRPVEFGFFCRSGPVVTPHIKGQVSLAAGERRVFPGVLAPGPYLIRTLDPGPECHVETASGRLPDILLRDGVIEAVNVEMGNLGARNVETGVPASDQWSVTNQSARTETLVIEDERWRADVLTAERVTTYQAFRDLFSEQVLRPGDEIRINTITFLFSDLTGSSALFEQVGDARAYQIVRDHFALIGNVIRKHDGTIVKTIGDGVHAAFASPDNALRAALSAQRTIDKELTEARDLDVGIRIGLHSGSSISVTLNGRLDYYGSAVNLAARLEGQGSRGDITMSAAFAADVGVQMVLREGNIPLVERTVTLKGFAEPVRIAQIHAASWASTRPIMG